MKKCIMLGCDIETGGYVLDKHPLLAVGLCIYLWDGKDLDGLSLLDVCEVHLQGDESAYDPGTLEFWHKNVEAWDIIREDIIPESEAAAILISFLKKWQLYAIENSLPFKTITDNCWFDDTFISWFLCRHGGLPLRYNYYTGYTKLCHMIDVNQRIEAFTAELSGKILPFTPSVPHDHTPVSDARGIVEKYVNYIMSTKAYRKRAPSVPVK